MFKRSILIFTLLIFAGLSSAQYINHNLEIVLTPDSNFVKVTDVITMPVDSARQEVQFQLHADLVLAEVDSSANYSIRQIAVNDTDSTAIQTDVPLKSYLVQINNGGAEKLSLKLEYQGEINHPIEQQAKEYARGFSQTPGIINDQGVYLSGSTYWIPKFDDELVTFNMTVYTPPEWDVVSQGTRTQREGVGAQNLFRWESPQPMDEVFCIAAKFTYYEKSVGDVIAMAYLRTPDPSLANKYLETTAQYMEMYNQLIGPYPYTKFALVENFWETGYGMPSFTLLGEKVIRFPFILHSSYPHELLHNWWGNSVFVDYKTGNWCEGLTAYMADHLIKEQRGQGVEYRRSALQAYTDYVNEVNDFPVNEFQSRFDAASSAIGYNKVMMLFNMMRQSVGDDIFIKSMQTFYRKNQFKRAGWNDIRQALASVTGRDYKFGFDQWLTRKGAPQLQLADAKVSGTAGNYDLTYTLTQIQPEDSFQVVVPVVVHLDGADKPFIQRVEMNRRTQTYEMNFENEPLLIEVDQQYDIFRRLHQSEIPPALSQIFGSDRVLIILPSSASDAYLNAYTELANKWASTDPEKIEIREDNKMLEVPSDRDVWLLGKENRFRTYLDSGIVDYNSAISDTMYRFGEESVSATNKSVIISFKNPRNPDNTMVWLHMEVPEAADGLSRKLPHYGKYSYLVFDGTEPANIVKGQWPVINSPLVMPLKDDRSVLALAGTNLPERQALATLQPVFSQENMLAHVNYLAGEDLKGRGLGSAELDQAADYIAEQFKKVGLQPGSDDGSYFQIWNAVVGKEMVAKDIKNVIGVIPGINPAYSGESVVVCAHYDHLGLGWPDVREGNAGKIHYGADDNASGVAVMIELAKLMAETSKPDRTIIFIAFTGEENGLMGSRYYVKNMKKFPADKIIGALNLDTVGRLGANKILILNSQSASEWKHIAMGIGHVTSIQYELISQELDASDQVSFIDAGVPAIQIFSGANVDYHKPSDTADKIDAEGMVKVAVFTKEAVEYLAKREDPLSFEGTVKKPQAKEDRSSQRRKVSTGIMPDFSHTGAGVKVAYVSPDSPAAKAGLRKGDVIVQLNYTRVADLKEYSNELKGFQPGDELTMVYMRDDVEGRVQVKLVAK
jgi:aminopeptidase N